MKVINLFDRIQQSKTVQDKPEEPIIEQSVDSLIQDNYLCNDDLASLKTFENIANSANNRRVTWDKYQHVPTQQLVKTVGDHLIRLGYDFTVKLVFGAKGKSTKHIAEFTLNNMLLANKEMAGKILVINSYNGECPITVLAGAIRFCCANGIIAGENESFEKIVHVIGETINDRLRRLTEKIDIAASYLVNNFGMRVDSMKTINTSYIKEIEILLNLDITEKVTLEVIKRRHPTNRNSLRVEDQGSNLWAFFNVINEVIREQSRTGLLEVESNLNLIDDMIRLAA